MQVLTAIKFKLGAPKPSHIFIVAALIFQVVPSLYILLFDVYSQRGRSHSYEDFRFAATWMAVSSCYVVFISLFLLAFSKGSHAQNSSFNRSSIKIPDEKIRFVIWSILLLCIFFTFLYGLNGGFYKLLLLGTDMDSREFRFLNFNEVDRKYTYLLQISRRILLPALIFFLILLARLGVRKLMLPLLCALVVQLLASSLTFARAPFAMLLVSIMLALYLSEQSIVKRMVLIVIGVISIVLMGGLITKLQYNILVFNFSDVIYTGLDFLVNRAWLVPAIIPINLSFALFDGLGDSLLLSGSRFFGLLTGDVIGTLQNRSVLVAPVGFIGDLWRNFGLIGIAVSPLFFSVLFGWLDRRYQRSSQVKRYLGAYMTIGLVFYWIMGVVFSAGAILVLVLVVLTYMPKITFHRTNSNALEVSCASID